jgi:uncharacterized RDD family membrane protein YckC
MVTRVTTYKPPDDSRNVALTGVRLASFSRRAAALVTDFFLAGFLFVLVVVGGGAALLRLGLLELEEKVTLGMTFYGDWYSIAWLVAYFTLSVYWGNGRTLGKRIWRIRIVSLVHERVNLWHAFERALGYGASTLEAGFGFFQYFIRPDRRTVHDRIAETIVVAEDSAHAG